MSLALTLNVHKDGHRILLPVQILRPAAVVPTVLGADVDEIQNGSTAEEHLIPPVPGVIGCGIGVAATAQGHKSALQYFSSRSH